MKFELDVTTKVLDGGLIRQEVRPVSEEERIADVIFTQVANTMDAQMRQALIFLGWTPPPVKVDVDTTVDRRARRDNWENWS